jgi:hypothetical protein
MSNTAYNGCFAKHTPLGSEGIVSGYPDGSYQPDKFINRAEFTVCAAIYDQSKKPAQSDDASDIRIAYRTVVLPY